MIFLSRYDTTFLTYMTRKYREYGKIFRTFDGYSIWLYEEICGEDTDKYYETLEKDIREYSNWQKDVKADDEITKEHRH